MGNCNYQQRLDLLDRKTIKLDKYHLLPFEFAIALETKEIEHWFGKVEGKPKTHNIQSTEY